jgi:TetR/AcrR family transcriptional regulator, transcriptional repressor for nem operon
MSKGEETRQHIIEKAAALFNQHGYEGTALSDLMEATDLRKGGIYRHFDSKEELAEEAFEHAWGVAWRTRVHGLEAIPNSVDRLKKLVRNFVEVRPPLPGGCPLLNTAIETDDGNARLRGRAREALRSWQEMIENTVRSGAEKGEIREDADSSAAAMLIIASLEGALMMSRLTHSDEPLGSVRAHLEDYVERNLRKN